MAFRTIVVQVDNRKSAPARIDYACRLAVRDDAHLIGICPIPFANLAADFGAVATPEIIEVQRRYLAEDAERAKTLFEEHVRRAGVRSEWRNPEGHPATVLAQAGRYADVVVAGQDDPEDSAMSAPAGLVEDLLFAVGRPVLTVPYIGAPETLATRVLVAWNASREATRALNDAIPLLKRAEKVTVLSVNPRPGDGGDGDVPSADICLHLARHGVKAEAAQTQARDIDAGDVILSRAADEGADLIVMGAYGHARLREQILGGVTRTLLDHMTVPVLMSH